MRLLSCLREGTVPEFFALTQTMPLALVETDSNGRTLLHHAMMQLGENGGAPTLAKIMLLLKVYPQGALERDETGSVPLHYACGLDDMNANVSGWTAGLLLFMKTKHMRSAMYIYDSQDRLPIHRVILAHKYNAATVLLQTLYRNADSTLPLDPRCAEGSLLHLALKYDAPDTFIQLVVDKLPQCVSLTDGDGDLALHSAVDYRVSLAQIQCIAHANPAALMTPGDQGYLPHHLEASIGGRLDVLQWLYQQAPDGYTQREDSGCCPLHVAVRNTAIEVECLSFLYSVYPDALDLVDGHGYSALHLACMPARSSTPVAVSTLSWLLDTRPLLTRCVCTDAGLLPLHVLAQQSHPALDALDVVGRADPVALETPDLDGHLPLHHAVLTKETQSPVSLNVTCLLDMYPQGAARIDAVGRLPLHIACANPSVTTDVLDVLYRHCPHATTTYDACGLLPCHYAATTTTMDFVWRTLDAYATAWPPARNGVPAVCVACEMNASLDVIVALVQCSLPLFL